VEQKRWRCHSDTVLHLNVTYSIYIAVPDGLIKLAITDEPDGGAYVLLGELVRKVSVDVCKKRLENWSVEGICRSCPKSTMLRADVTYDGGSTMDKRLSEETCFLFMTRRRLVCRTSITKTVEL
jgi:hypothetical protein